MKLLLSAHKDNFRRTALLSFSLFFAAHAFCFFNLTYSGSSVMLDVSRIRSMLIENGQFLAPYYFRLRGSLSAPLWVGMLSALYLVLTSIIASWLLGLKKPGHLFILCGSLAANAALTAIFAASLHTADASMLALLLCSAGAACCLRLRYGFVPGAALVSAAMALDPGSLAFFAALACIAWLGDLLADAKTFVRSAGCLLLAAAAASAVWYLGSMLMARRSGCTLNIALHMPAAGLSSAYFTPIRALLSPLTAYTHVSMLLRALLALLSLAFVVMNARKLGMQRTALLVSGVLLLPLLCALPLFYLKDAAQITPAYCLLDVLLLMLTVRLMPEKLRLHTAAASAFGILFLGSIVFSNQVYLKKNLEFEATLSLTSRIIQRAEETEGYRPGFTPVAVIGTMEDSVFSVPRKGFEHLSALDAAENNYAVTSEDEMIWYCWEILGYPASFVSTYERSLLKENDAVKAMPAFPADGCSAFVGDTLVIRLN